MSDSTSDKSLSFVFWSHLENILRPPTSRTTANTTHATTTHPVNAETSLGSDHSDYVVVTEQVHHELSDLNGLSTNTLVSPPPLTSPLAATIAAGAHSQLLTTSDAHISSSEEIYKRLNVRFRPLLLNP